MQWNDYELVYTKAVKALGRGAVNPKNISICDWYKLRVNSYIPDKEVGHRLASEALWVDARRPYFNLWPLIAEGLITTPLNLPCSTMLESMRKLPYALVVRTTPTASVVVRGCCLESFLVSRMVVGGFPGLMVLCQVVNPSDEFWHYYFALQGNATIEEELNQVNAVNGGLSADETCVCVAAVRILLGICLMADDPALVQPIVLNRDRLKYQKNQDPRLVEKAHRQGVVGWDVGKSLVITPHYRRPHFGLRWTGKGRQIPKIVPITGSIVKRSKLTEVPTGYLDHE